MGRLSAYVQLTRPLNVALAVLGTTVGGLAAAGRNPHVLALGLTCLVTALGTAGGNALNDALDADVDRGAHPQRPVPRRRLTAADARWWGATLLAASLVTAGFVGFWIVLLAALLVGNLLLYEGRLKAQGLWGNFLISYNVGGLFVLGGLAALLPVLSYAPSPILGLPSHVGLGRSLVMAFLAGLLNLAREIYKDAEDVAHDASSRRTFAVLHGSRRARRLGDGVALFAIPLALLPYGTGLFGPMYLILLVPLLGLLILVPFVRTPRKAQTLVKVAMTLGFLPFLATALI